MMEQGFLQMEAAPKPPESPVGCHNPVAGNEEHNGISTTSLTHGPGTLWSPNPAGNLPVSCNFSRRDLSQCSPDLHMELATLEIKRLL